MLASVAAALLLGAADAAAAADVPFCPSTLPPGTVAVVTTPPGEPRAAARQACPKGYAVVTQQTCRTINVEKQTSPIVLHWVIRCLNFGGRP